MFEFKTKPFPYQKEIWNKTKDEKCHALFMEQGTGKTKVTLDTVAWLYEKGLVKNLLVVAPSGVHRNWVVDEIPKHLPNGIPRRMLTYQSSKASTKAQQNKLYDLLDYKKGLAVLAMSYDAFITKAGKEAAWKFMKRKKLMYVLDESTRIKNPKARRTKAILKSGDFSDYKRILTGTPIANGPFDIWAPIEFLNKEVWRKFRFSSFWVFKHYFGDIVKKRANLGHEYEFVKGYRNLDELYRILQPISTRVTKDEVLKDLPPKLFSTRYFEMSKEQERAYQELKDNYMVQIEGQVITAELALTRLLRLQQITCGYVPNLEDDSVDAEPYISIPGPNARLEALNELTQDLSTQGIIWARFTKDIDNIVDLLNSPEHGGAVRYDGKQDEDQRAKAIDTFRAGKAQWFVGNAAVGGEGLTLTEAKAVIYYSNSFKLTERLQSEDRAHRIGQDTAVTYYDLAAENTIDEYIIKALLKKIDIANTITGDRKKAWIQLQEQEENQGLVNEAVEDALNIFFGGKE